MQRYLAAVQAGEAQAWHTLVFGVVLALYSLPLRQGLTHFAQQTLGGFIDAAGCGFALSPSARNELLTARAPQIQAAVTTLLDAEPAGASLRVLS